MTRRLSLSTHNVRQRLYDRLRARGYQASIHTFKKDAWGYSLLLNEGDIPTETWLGASTEELLLAKCIHVLENPQ